MIYSKLDYGVEVDLIVAFTQSIVSKRGLIMSVTSSGPGGLGFSASPGGQFTLGQDAKGPRIVEPSQDIQTLGRSP